MGKSIAFGWYGGKYSHLDWLLPLLPPSQHFCDVFGGSAAVIINRPPAPVETYNDIHSEVVNFFRVLLLGFIIQPSLHIFSRPIVND
jgi:DNA adenine methylase